MKNSNGNPTVNNLGVSTDINHPTYEEIIESISYGEIVELEYKLEYKKKEYLSYKHDSSSEELIDLEIQQGLISRKIHFKILSELEKYNFSKDKYDLYIKILHKKILDCFDNGNIRKSLYDIHLIVLNELSPLFSFVVLDSYPNYFVEKCITNIIKDLQSIIDDEDIARDIPYIFFRALTKRDAGCQGAFSILDIMDYNYYKKNSNKISERYL